MLLSPKNLAFYLKLCIAFAVLYLGHKDADGLKIPNFHGVKSADVGGD